MIKPGASGLLTAPERGEGGGLKCIWPNGCIHSDPAWSTLHHVRLNRWHAVPNIKVWSVSTLHANGCCQPKQRAGMSHVCSHIHRSSGGGWSDSLTSRSIPIFPVALTRYPSVVNLLSIHQSRQVGKSIMLSFIRWSGGIFVGRDAFASPCLTAAYTLLTNKNQAHSCAYITARKMLYSICIMSHSNDFCLESRQRGDCNSLASSSCKASDLNHIKLSLLANWQWHKP